MAGLGDTSTIVAAGVGKRPPTSLRCPSQQETLAAGVREGLRRGRIGAGFRLLLHPKDAGTTSGYRLSGISGTRLGGREKRTLAPDPKNTADDAEAAARLPLQNTWLLLCLKLRDLSLEVQLRIIGRAARKWLQRVAW
ncbi:hypothetical protein MRX96_005571 [Rhipicephalus microplus]